MVKKYMIALVGLALFGSTMVHAASWPDNLSRNERRRLHSLMQNTWKGLDKMYSDVSGLPFESTLSRGRTTPSTVGLYLASLCVAQRLGYLKEDEAVQRIERILSSLDALPHWNRLYGEVLPTNGQDRDPIPGAGALAGYINLPAGMMVVRTSFPPLARRCTDFLNAVPWAEFYDSKSDRLYRQFDVVKKTVRDPVSARPEDELRLAHFLMVASRQVPATTWPDARDLKSGPLRPIRGSLFLDPRGTPAGREKALAAWRQIEHALNIGAPVWGWALEANLSAALSPTFAVVHPYVSAQALPFFPREVLRNFDVLEKIGALDPIEGDDTKTACRFRNNINWRTGEMAGYYSTEHQARLFLAMANYLERRVLWRTFQADSLARSGLRQLADCRGTEYKRTMERKFIRALSRKMPGTFWWFETGSLTPMAGDLLQASLWAKSLCVEPLERYTEHWRLTDRAGRVMAEGEESFKLAPREARKLTEIMIPTARMRPGVIWTLESELRQDGKILATMERDIRFRRHK